MQGILGTSPNNPKFYVRNNKKKNTIEIHYGFNLLTEIPNNKNSLLFRSTIAMLAGVEICYSHIKENLNISHKTIKNTLEIFRNANDDNDLIKNFRPPGRSNYKMNEEIFNYILNSLFFRIF